MPAIPEARHARHARAQIARLVAAGEVPRRADAVGRPRAVLHARHEEEAVPVVERDAQRNERALDLLAEVQGAARRDEAVGPAVVVEELAPARAVVLQVGEGVGGGVARVERVGALDDAVVEVLPLEVGQAEEVADVVDAVGAGLAGGRAEQEGPLRFGARREAGQDEGDVGVDVGVVDLVEGVELGGGEAGGGVGGGRAEEDVRVEGAGARVGDDVVDEAVLAVALLEDFGADGGEEGGWDAVAAVQRQVVRADLGRPRLQVGRPPGGCAGEDAVEVVREELRAADALPAAGGAAAVVRVLDLRTVKGGGELLGELDGAVHGAPSPVREGFGCVLTPNEVSRRGVVASIR